MDRADSQTPLLTVEDVLGWVEERGTIRRERERLSARLKDLETRLRFASLLMPPEQAARLIGNIGEDEPSVGPPVSAVAKPAKEQPRTVPQAILEVLAGESGGRAPSWIKQQIAKDPVLRPRANGHSVSNSLSRLKDRAQLIHTNGLYYLPETWAAIESGAIVEEDAGNRHTFTSRMLSVASSLGKPFDAKELRSAAMEEADLRDRITNNPNAVNSWIGRRVDRGDLIKEGRAYRFASNENGAPNGDAAGAPDAGRGATLPNESGGDFDGLFH